LLFDVLHWELSHKCTEMYDVEVLCV